MQLVLPVHMESLDELNNSSNCSTETQEVILNDSLNVEAALDIAIKNEEVDLEEEVIILSDNDENDRFLCDVCGFITYSESIFKRHGTYHNCNPNLLSCQECTYKAVYKGDLNLHIYATHPQEVNPAFKLLKTETGPVSLKKSVATSKWFKCDHCGYKSTILAEHTHHREQHLSQKSVNCGTTDRNKFPLHNIGEHVKSEKAPADDIYKCSACDYQSKYVQDVVSHRRRCASLRREQFQQSNSQGRILWYKCGLCPFKANQEFLVGSHMQTFHDLDLANSHTNGKWE